ncbi:S-methyl-5'-thioinosine phosphorylase [Endothiovibrio diazotrophicus]
MSKVAIIGGTGLTRLEGLEIEGEEMVTTPFGEPSSPLVRGRLEGREVLFLARHGNPHRIPPHRVNYRANLWALYQADVRAIFAAAAVGGISEFMGPAMVCVPDQIIDYTYGRSHTYYEEGLDHVTHVDFTEPYDATLRGVLGAAAAAAGVEAHDGGCYGATQGPRLESAAEVRKLRRDGCDMVGMTGMPEAALARELGIRYACCAVSANWGAGLSEGEITMEEIERCLEAGMAKVRRILRGAIVRV